MLTKHKYYFNSEVYGEIYNWKEIFKLYKSLNIPDILWKVRPEALNSKYSVILSARSVSKTTNVLLLGLCQRAIYGTTVIYVRAEEGQFTPTEAKKLTKVIASYDGGRYVKQLTNGRYNSIVYKARAFYYADVDADGQVLERERDECIKVLTVDNWYEYKSGLNIPKGDFMIFDEFVGPNYRPDEFVNFCDLIKTVFRERMSPVIFMLANTLSTTSPYYGELEIKKWLRVMKSGEHMSVTTEKGTKIYIELAKLSEKAQEKRSFFNSLFLGFKNDKLGAITGGQLWALPEVPHIYRRDEDDKPEYIIRNLYIDADGDYLRCDLVEDKKTGIHLEVVPSLSRKIKDDAIILTCDPPTDPRELFLLGGKKRNIRNILLTMINECKVYYATNEEGAIFKNYINKALLLENNPL